MNESCQHAGIVQERVYRFVLWLMPAVDKFPRSQKFLLGDRIQSLALEVLEGLVGATYTRERRPILTRVNLHLDKLRVLLRLAKDLRHLDLRRYEHAIGTTEERKTAFH